MDVSIVIPTFKRGPMLARCLEALARQESAPSAYEVIVVDDGGNDDTQAVVSAARCYSPFAIEYLSQDHCGPGAARNLGVDAASGRVVVFIGDDIIATPGFLASHIHAHRHQSDPGLAVLGRTTWAPRLRVSLLMEFLEQNGEQFAYEKIENPENVEPRFFYTSNISLKREFLLAGPRFEADLFPWEDIDLALRLVPLGLRIVYRPEALAYHDHPVDLTRFLRRMRLCGAAARRMDAKRNQEGRLTDAERMLRENARNHRIRTFLFPAARFVRWRRVVFAYYENRGLEEFCKGYQG